MESAAKIFPDHAHESNDNHQQESKTPQSNELSVSEQAISGTSETECVEFEAHVEDLPKPHITVNKEDDSGPALLNSGNSHLLVESAPLDLLTLPIKASSRIKYTSLCVSEKYVCLGSNTGAVYLFVRSDLRFLQSIQGDKDSSEVTQLSLAPSEQLLAYATSSGIVNVVEHNAGRREKTDRRRTSALHRGSQVTCLRWHHAGNKVFVGDNTGTVSSVNVSREFFKLPNEVLMKLDSCVTQIDTHGEYILVSTLTRSYLGNTAKQQFSQIGKKPRDSAQGGCIFPGSGLASPLVYCARPGARVWEVNSAGTVLNTHQFKHILDRPATPIVNIDSPAEEFALSRESPGPRSLPFTQLHRLGEHYLLSLCDQGLFIINPCAVALVLWTDQIIRPDVVSYDMRKQDVYLLHPGNCVRKLTLMPVHRLIERLYQLGLYSLCARIALAFRNVLLSDRYASKYELNVAVAVALSRKLQLLGQTDLAEELKTLLSSLNISMENSTDNEEHNPYLTENSHFNKSDSGIFISRKRTISFESSGSFSDGDNEALIQRIIQSQPAKSGSDENVLAETSSELNEPVVIGSDQKPPDPDAVSQSSETSGGEDQGKVEGNWGLKNAAQLRLGQAQSTLLGLKNKLKGKLTTPKKEGKDKTQVIAQHETIVENDVTKIDPVLDVNLNITEISSQDVNFMSNMDENRKRSGSTTERLIMSLTSEAGDNEGILMAQEADDNDLQNIEQDGRCDILAGDIDQNNVIGKVTRGNTICDNATVEVNQRNNNTVPESVLNEVENREIEKFHFVASENLGSVTYAETFTQISNHSNENNQFSNVEVNIVNTNLSVGEDSFQAAFSNSNSSSSYGVLTGSGSKGASVEEGSCGKFEEGGASLPRKKSCDSLLSYRSADQISSDEKSRDLSISSQNSADRISANTISLGPEPRYRQTLGPVSTGRKKRASIVSFDEADGTQTNAVTKSTKFRRSKSDGIARKKSKAVKIATRHQSFEQNTDGNGSKDGISEMQGSDTNIIQSASPQVSGKAVFTIGEEHTTLPVMSETEITPQIEAMAVVPEPSTHSTVSPDSTVPSSVTPDPMIPSAVTPNRISLSSVREKLSTTAKSLVQTIKHKKDQITHKEFQPPLDVAAPPPPSPSEAGGGEEGREEGREEQAAAEAEPLVDLTGLQQATHTAMEKLKELPQPHIKSDLTTQVLEPWVQQLNLTVMEAIRKLLAGENVQQQNVSGDNTGEEQRMGYKDAEFRDKTYNAEKLESCKICGKIKLNVQSNMNRSNERRTNKSDKELSVLPENEVRELDSAEYGGNSQDIISSEHYDLETIQQNNNDIDGTKATSGEHLIENKTTDYVCDEASPESVQIGVNSDSREMAVAGSTTDSQYCQCGTSTSIQTSHTDQNPYPVEQDNIQISSVDTSEKEASSKVVDNAKLPVMLFVADPLNMPEALHDDVTYLATLCYEHGCYGLQEEDFGGSLDGDTPSQRTDGENPQRADPSHLFLQRHYHCLDVPTIHPHTLNMAASIHTHTLNMVASIHTHTLNMAASRKRRALWDVLFKCMQAAFLEQDHDIEGGLITGEDLPVCLTLPYLYNMLKSDHTRALHLCCSHKLPVTPVDVLYMCYNQSEGSVPQLIHQYVLTQLEMASGEIDRLSLLSSLCEDREVYEAVLQAFLTVDRPKDQPNCACGTWPRPLAHWLAWKHEDVLLDLLTLHPDLRQYQLYQSAVHGFWRGYMLLQQQDHTEREASTDSRLHLSALVLQLNDKQLWSAMHQSGMLAETAEDWQEILKMKTRLSFKHNIPKSSSHSTASAQRTGNRDMAGGDSGPISGPGESLYTDLEKAKSDLPENDAASDCSEDDCPVFIFTDDEQVHQNQNEASVHSETETDDTDNRTRIEADDTAGSITDSITAISMKTDTSHEQITKAAGTLLNIDSHKKDGNFMYCLGCREALKTCEIDNFTFKNNFSSSSQSDVGMKHNMGPYQHSTSHKLTDSDWLPNSNSANQNSDNKTNNNSDWISIFESAKKEEREEVGEEDKACDASSAAITWEFLAYSLVECIGTGSGLRMLEGVSVPLAELSLEFYKNCVVKQVLEKQHRQMLGGVLEKLDEALFPETGDQTTGAPVQVCRVPGKPVSTEEHTHGVFNPHSLCVVCGLALSEKVLQSGDQSVTILHCGHGFHSVCITDECCIICEEDQQ